jgi:hypothetical protein
MLIGLGRRRLPWFGWHDGRRFQGRVNRWWELSDQQLGRNLGDQQLEQLGRELSDQQFEQDRRDRIDRGNLKQGRYDGHWWDHQSGEFCQRR